MSSIIRLKKWLFSNREVRFQIIGLEEAGKTTLLYTFKNDERDGEGPKPLMSYNYETVQRPSGWNFTVIDVWEGCSPFMMKHGLWHFMTPETLVWFVHDCTRNEFSLDSYIKGMNEKGAQYIWVILNKQDLLPPNERQDIVSDHWRKLEAILKQKAEPLGISWYVVDTPGFDARKGSFVRPFVKSVTQTVLHVNTKAELKHQKTIDEAMLSMTGKDELRKKAEQTQLMPGEEFWKAFASAEELTSWNHTDHLQAGYLVMLQSVQQGDGLLKCSDVFLRHLMRLRRSRPDVFRNTSHFTMTAFWIIQIRIATFNFQYDVNEGALPVQDDFRSVLLHTPSLLDIKLWMRYYSKDTLFGPDARGKFVMPDLEPFPQVTKPLLNALADGKDDLEAEQDSAPQEESLFIGPDRVLQWAFALIQNVLCNNLRRGKALKEGLEALQVDTIKLRARYPTVAKSGGVPPYSETQAYFWAQIVHIRLQSWMDSATAQASGAKLDSLTYDQFKRNCGVSGMEWKDYYSSRLWDSVEARLEFCNPDKKALPDLL